MKTGIAAAMTCGALALMAGCGSSSTSTGSSTPTATTTTTTTGAKASTSTSDKASSGGSSLKIDTTPKFATPSTSAPVQSGLVQIAYRDIAIDPDTVRVKLGSTIRWTNYDSTQANVTSEGGTGGYKFASKNFGEGGTFELEASKPGVIHYECTLYPVTMNGTIEVVS
jgi:plastocyanin